jgi:hypothetical protein
MADIEADIRTASIQPIQNADGSLTLIFDFTADIAGGHKKVRLRLKTSATELDQLGDMFKSHAARPPTSTARN